MSLLYRKKCTVAVLLISFMLLSILNLGCLGAKPPAEQTPSGEATEPAGDTGTTPTKTTGTTGTKPSGEPFRIGIVTWPGFGPLFVAKEKGFFDGLNVEITPMDDTVPRRAAFSSKKVEAITETLDSFACGIASIPGKAVLKTDDSCGGDGLIVNKKIQKVNELKGKKIAFPQGLPSHFFLVYLLSLTGLSSKDITPVYMEATQAAQAFEAGKVDACVTWEPDLSRAGNSKNGKILMTSADAQGLILDVIVVRDDVIKNRPKDVQKLVNGWFRGLEYAKQNKDEANKIMAEGLVAFKPEDVDAMLTGLKFADLQENQTYFGTAKKPGQFVDIFDTAGMIWEQEGLLTKPASGKDKFNSTFVQAVPKDIATKIEPVAVEPTAAPTEVAVAETPAEEPTEAAEPTKAPEPTKKPTAKPAKPTPKPTPSKPKNQDIATLEVPPIYFETGSSSINKNSYFTLSEIGKKLLHFPTLYIRIEGHTDNIGDPQMNKELSQARANSVKAYLLKKYPQIKKDRLIAKGYGDTKPIDTNDTEDGRSNNRRTEFVIQR
ncbi:MAG: OmpA family protein [Candidatus Eremiobacterota bacterium]